MRKEKPTYVSVTLDFLHELPDLNIKENKENLEVGLYALGFDLTEIKNQQTYEIINDVIIRCKKYPYKYKKATVFNGRLRKDFAYKSMYDKIEILDTNNEENFNLLVCDLDYFLPYESKLNSNKHKKK